MRTMPRLAFAAVTLAGTLLVDAAVAEDRIELPIGTSKITLSDGPSARQKRISFAGSFKPTSATMPDPRFVGAGLRVSGAPGEGDSGLIRLPARKWRKLP